MAKLKIFTYTDAVLAQKAKPIARVEKRLFKLADDMFETMYDSPGVGLAANQVGILERILVIDTDYEIQESEDEGETRAGSEVAKPTLTGKKPRILINPILLKKEGSILFEEGCLSVPEFSAEVKRSEKIIIKFQDLDGMEKTLDAEGFLAVAIQHEMDHLEGKLFIDRLSPLKKEMVRKRLLKERSERESKLLASTGRARKKDF